MIDSMFDHLNGFRTAYQLWTRRVMPNTGGPVVFGEWLPCGWYDTVEEATEAARLGVPSKIVKVLCKDLRKEWKE